MALVSLVSRQQAATNRVTDLIRVALAEERKKQPLLADEWIRVSSIGGLCPREEVLCYKNDVVRSDTVDGDAGLNFEMGNAIHWLFQNRAIGKTGYLIGSWRCTYCGEVYGSRDTKMVPRPSSCIRCGALAGEAPRSMGRPDPDAMGNAFLYVEEWLGNEEFKIGGSPDGQMVFCDPNDYAIDDLTLLEFKSCNDRNFVKYKEYPDFVHVIQTQVYMWLTGIRKAKILYLNKNFSPAAHNPIHEHDLDYDHECIERIQAAITDIRTGISTGQLPERSVCATPDCSRAIGCKVSTLCFSNNV